MEWMRGTTWAFQEGTSHVNQSEVNLGVINNLLLSMVFSVRVGVDFRSGGNP